MPTAFVLVNTDVGMESDVQQELRSLEECLEAYIVYGAYDLVTKVNTETSSTLKEVITKKIRTIPAVRSTMTLLVVL